ncbi:MAG: LamG domain-containing protein [Opitutaceae bacterium]|nr:LamG domain-containing protein [Opitutaceae bacterium]
MTITTQNTTPAPRPFLRLAVMLALAPAALPSIGAQDALPAPALHYAPSAPGSAQPNAGTNAGLATKPNLLVLKKNTAPKFGDCAPADLVLGEGTGPFQKGRAIDFSANETNGGKVTHMASAPRTDLGGLDACTLTLWYKLDSPLARGAYTTLFRSSTLDLLFVGDELRAIPRGTSAAAGAPERLNAPRNPLLAREGEWVFVALAWDGATGVTTLWCGNESARAAVLKSASLAARGKSVKSAMVVNLGYHNLTDGGTRAFDGRMADIRFHTTALSPSQVEAVRVDAARTPARRGRP